MERNVVIFGPAKAGKSTLLGYVYANCTPGFDLEKAISDIRKRLGVNYNKKSKYAYIFDTLPDEVLREHDRGTTRTMKKKKIRINDYEIIIIDTPGAEHRYRERVKGMYYGEIGVFMVELLNLTEHGLLDQTNENTLKEFFTPLCLWYGFKDKKRKTIVTISKMDTGSNPFSEEEFIKATEIIKTISRDETIEIIPISIIVDKDCDHNVLRKSEKLWWYSGPTLLDRLHEVIEETPTDEIDEPLFSHINKKHDITGVRRVVTVKILQGTLINGSTVKITPVKCKNEIYVSSLAKVKNIQDEEGKDIEIAKKGDLVGLNIDYTRMEGKKCKKENLDIIDSSCIVDLHTPLSLGNVLQFRYSSKKIEKEETEKFHLLESVMILWFGRFVSSKVINIDDGVVTLEIDTKNAPKVSLPLDNNSKFLFDNFILKRREPLFIEKGKDKKDVGKDIFISATLEKLGVPHTLTLSLKNINNKKEYIEEYFEDFSYDILADKILFYCGDSLSDLVSKIKRINVRLIEEPEDVFPNINIEIQELKEV